MTQALKSLPEYFQEILLGNKTFEIRKDDRNFQPQDKIILQEWNDDEKKYTGREIVGTITHVHRPPLGLKQGWCVFSFTVEEKPKTEEEQKPKA